MYALDRRHLRLTTPIYELPETGNALIDFLGPFIIIYSAEQVGLPEVPLLSEMVASLDGEPGGVDRPDYVRASYLPRCIMGSDEPKASLLVPEVGHLVQSEVHVLLQHANRTAVWGQRMAQLSELIRSPGCEKGFESLHEIVKPGQVKFAHWGQNHSQGNSDREALDFIRDEYRNVGSEKST